MPEIADNDDVVARKQKIPPDQDRISEQESGDAAQDLQPAMNLRLIFDAAPDVGMAFDQLNPSFLEAANEDPRAGLAEVIGAPHHDSDSVRLRNAQWTLPWIVPDPRQARSIA